MNPIERQSLIKSHILSQFVPTSEDNTIVIQEDVLIKAIKEEGYEVYTVDAINTFIREIQKASQTGRIKEDEIEKAKKDLSKLVKVTKMDKNGKKVTVWVKRGEDPKAEKKGKSDLSNYKSHTKDDKAEIEATIKRQKSLLANPKSPASAKKRAQEILKIEEAKLNKLGGVSKSDSDQPKGGGEKSPENKQDKPERSADHEALIKQKKELAEKVKKTLANEKDPDRRAELTTHASRLEAEHKELSGEGKEEQKQNDAIVGTISDYLKEAQEKDREQDFYDVISEYYNPEDDGESEYKMLDNLKKLDNKTLRKIDDNLAEKFAQESDTDEERGSAKKAAAGNKDKKKINYKPYKNKPTDSPDTIKREIDKLSREVDSGEQKNSVKISVSNINKTDDGWSLKNLVTKSNFELESLEKHFPEYQVIVKDSGISNQYHIHLKDKNNPKSKNDSKERLAKIASSPKGSIISGGGSYGWEKIAGNGWKNLKTGVIKHDQGINDYLGDFDDFKITPPKQEKNNAETKSSTKKTIPQKLEFDGYEFQNNGEGYDGEYTYHVQVGPRSLENSSEISDDAREAIGKFREKMEADGFKVEYFGRDKGWVSMIVKTTDEDKVKKALDILMLGSK